MLQLNSKQSLFARLMNFLRTKKQSFVRYLKRFWFWLEPIKLAVLFFLILSTVFIILGFYYVFWTDMAKGIFIEAVGAAMDILIFGILLALVSLLGEKRNEVKRQQEIIDDFKKWNSDEARYRIAGAIRRLVRLNKTEIDFSGIELYDFSFPKNDIKNISGSTFHDGTWGTLGSRDKVHLERVDFTDTDCRNVIFSKSNPLSGLSFDASFRFATFRDCHFSEAKLEDAIFRGAHIEWTNEPPEKMGTWIELENGEAAFLQEYYPPFHCADMEGVSFENAVFKHADFREAINIEKCNFRNARGLENSLFNNDEIKKQILDLL